MSLVILTFTITLLPWALIVNVIPLAQCSIHCLGPVVHCLGPVAHCLGPLPTVSDPDK